MPEQQNPTVRSDGTSDARQIARVILWLIRKVQELQERVRVLEGP